MPSRFIQLSISKPTRSSTPFLYVAHHLLHFYLIYFTWFFSLLYPALKTCYRHTETAHIHIFGHSTLLFPTFVWTYLHFFVASLFLWGKKLSSYRWWMQPRLRQINSYFTDLSNIFPTNLFVFLDLYMTGQSSSTLKAKNMQQLWPSKNNSTTNKKDVQWQMLRFPSSMWWRRALTAEGTLMVVKNRMVSSLSFVWCCVWTNIYDTVCLSHYNIYAHIHTHGNVHKWTHCIPLIHEPQASTHTHTQLHSHKDTGMHVHHTHCVLLTHGTTHSLHTPRH